MAALGFKARGRLPCFRGAGCSRRCEVACRAGVSPVAPPHSSCVQRAGTERRFEMNNTRYRWVIVAAGGLLGCVAIGGMFSLPVLLQPIARDTGWSVTGVSSAMPIGFLGLAFGSIAWGSLSDRFGPRAIVLTGAIILIVSLALAAQATSLVAFQLIFGLLVGGSAAAIIVP